MGRRQLICSSLGVLGMNVFFAIATLISGLLTSTSSRADDNAVWYWFTACGGPKMALEVHLDQRVLYQSAIPLCHAARGSPASQGHERRISFGFTPHRAIEWKGYRDEPDVTGPEDELDADIWLAGADPDALILGVSFRTADAIYMNTVHIAHPSQRDETELANGLVLITTPAEGGSP